GVVLGIAVMLILVRRRILVLDVGRLGTLLLSCEEDVQLVLDQRTTDVGRLDGTGLLVALVELVDIASRVVCAVDHVVVVARCRRGAVRLPQNLSTEVPLVRAALTDLAD